MAGAVHDSFARPTDLTARFGGEEFSVILPATPAAALPALAEKLRAAVAALQIPHSGATAAAHVTVSVGGATLVPALGAAWVDLIQAADEALYEAKETGRNRVVTCAAPSVGNPAGVTAGVAAG